MADDRLRSAALLLPQPLLTYAYLRAIRAERATPRFWPVVLLGVLPLAVLAVAALRRAQPGGLRVAVIAVAVLELGFAALAAAMIGFAIGFRSG